MCRKLSCQTDNLNWKNQNRDGHYTITATWNAHAHTHSYTQANKWISFYYPWNRTKSERETNMLYNVVYSKSIVWIVSSAPFVVLTPFGYVDQRDNNACEWTRTWESEEKREQTTNFINHENHHHHHRHRDHYQCHHVCVRAKKRRPPKRQEKWFSLIANNDCKLLYRYSFKWSLDLLDMDSCSLTIYWIGVFVCVRCCQEPRTPKAHKKREEKRTRYETKLNRIQPNPTKPNQKRHEIWMPHGMQNVWRVRACVRVCASARCVCYLL